MAQVQASVVAQLARYRQVTRCTMPVVAPEMPINSREREKFAASPSGTHSDYLVEVIVEATAAVNPAGWRVPAPALPGSYSGCKKDPTVPLQSSGSAKSLPQFVVSRIADWFQERSEEGFGNGFRIRPIQIHLNTRFAAQWMSSDLTEERTAHGGSGKDDKCGSANH